MCEYLVGNKCTAIKDEDYCPKNKSKFEMSYLICMKIFNPTKKVQVTMDHKEPKSIIYEV